MVQLKQQRHICAMHPQELSHTHTKTITIITTVLFAVIAVLLFAFQTQAQTPTPLLISTQTIQDGDLIRATATNDVYIVKIINEKRFKRLIINPDIFESYGHLEWENVQDVPQSALDSYQTSNLVRRENDSIYRIYPDGDGGTKTKLELTAIQFVQAGIDIDSIYIINDNEFNLYATIDPITTPEEYQTRTAPASTPSAPQEQTPTQPADGQVQQPQTITDGDLIRATGTADIYIVKIINNKQFKRLIINPDIFESYGHLEWENVQDVPQSIVDSYQTSNLVRRETDATIYRIYPDNDSGTKAQLNLNQEQLQQAGIDQDSIYTINTNEFNLYRTLNPITTPEEYATPTVTDPAEQTPPTLPVDPTPTEQPTPAPRPSSGGIISVITDNKVRPPKNLRTTEQTLTTLTIQWSQVSNADQGYEIQWCAGSCAPNAEWTNKQNIQDKNTTTHAIENLELQTTYKIRIKSIQSDTKESEYATITHTMVLPQPENLSVTNHQTNQLTLTWTEVTGATAGYSIQYKKPTEQEWSTAIPASNAETEKQITGLDSGTTYQIRIQAQRTNNPDNIESEYSTITSTTTPDNPTAPTISNHQTTSITLSWTPPTTGDAITYEIEYCSNLANCPVNTPQGSWTTIKTRTTTNSTINLSSLDPQTTYNIRVRSTKQTEETKLSSPYSATTFITKPTVPQNLQLSTQTTQLTIQWDQNSQVTSYTVQYCTGTCDSSSPTDGTTGDQNKWIISTSNANSQTITGLTLGRTYYARVRAVKVLQVPSTTLTSEFTSIKSEETRLNPPNNFRATPTATTIVLNWDQNTDASNGYEIQWCTINCPTSTDWGDTQTVSSTTYTIPSLTKSTNYQVRIKSLASGGGESTYQTIQTSTATDPPTPTISNQETTTATISWTSVQGANQYQVQYCINHATNCQTDGTGQDYANNSTTTSSTSKNLTNLTSATRYNIKVRTIRGTSSYSTWTTTSFITKPENIDQSSFQASPQTTSVTLNWAVVQRATSYQVQHCTGSCSSSTPTDGTTGDSNKWIISTSNTNSATISSLTTDTEYKFRVRATKTITNPTDTQHSNYTSSISATPVWSGPILTPSAQTTNSVTITWSQDADATGGYTIQYCHSGACNSSSGTSSTNTDTNKWFEFSTPASSDTSETLASLPLSGTTYTIRIQSKTTASPPVSSRWSTITTATIPHIPTNPVAGTATTTTIPFSWTAPTQAPSGGYQVQYCERHITNCSASGSGTNWDESTNAPTAVSSTSTTLSGLDEGVVYNIRVRSVASTTPKAYSAWTTPRGVNTILSVPTNLQVSTGASDTTLNVSWTAVSAATHYVLRVCADITGCSENTDWTNRVQSVISTSTSGTIPALQPGTSYQVRIEAQRTSFNNNVYSEWSPSDTETTSGTAPSVGTPTISSLNPTASQQITANWTTITNATGGYQIQWCQSSDSNCDAAGTGSSWTSISLDSDDANATKGTIHITSQSASSQVMSGFTNNIEYRFRMRSLASFTVPPFTTPSPWSATITATPINATIPATPSGLSATAHSNTAINISWTAGATTGTGIPTGYDVQHCTGSNCGNSGSGWTDFSPNPALTGTSTSTTVTSLSASTAYKIRIRAKNSAGNSAGWATSSSVTTYALATPTGVSSSHSGTDVNFVYTYFTDTWDGVTYWTKQAGDYFRVERCILTVHSGETRSSSNHSVTCETYSSRSSNTAANYSCEGTDTSCNISLALNSGLTYKYRVQACSTSACTSTSAWSATATVRSPNYPACARKQTPDCPG